MQCLDHARALGPTRPRPGRQRDHRHFAPAERRQPLRGKCRRLRGGRLRHREVRRLNLLNHGAGGEPVLGQSNPAVFEIGGDLSC